MPDELDKILNDLHFKGGLWNSKGELSPSTHASNDPCVEEAKTQLNALFLSQALDLIGADEPSMIITDQESIRNNLRAELRAVFRERFGNGN